MKINLNTLTQVNGVSLVFTKNENTKHVNERTLVESDFICIDPKDISNKKFLCAAMKLDGVIHITIVPEVLIRRYLIFFFAYDEVENGIDHTSTFSKDLRSAISRFITTALGLKYNTDVSKFEKVSEHEFLEHCQKKHMVEAFVPVEYDVKTNDILIYEHEQEFESLCFFRNYKPKA